MSEALEMFAQLLEVQRLPPHGKVGLRYRPNPRGAIPQDLPEGNMLPAGLADHLFEADDQVLRRAQDPDVPAGEDRAEGGFLGLDCEPTHQDGAHLRFLPASIDRRHHPIQRDLHAQVCGAPARSPRVHYGYGFLSSALGLPLLEVLGGAVDEALGPTRAEGHARAPLKEVVGHPMGQLRDYGRVEGTHVVREVAPLRDTQVVVIRTGGGSTPATLEGAHRDLPPGQQGTMSAPLSCWASRVILAWRISRATSRTCVKIASEAVATRWRSEACQDSLDKPFAPLEELFDDEVVVHGVPPDEKA